MLAPDEFLTLQDALRPPEDHRLDLAVGTAYSLDLLAFLAAPVAFAMFDLQTSDDLAALDGLSVLESVRRYADATTVFCQAGAIAVPAAYRSVLTWTEGSVIEVRRPTPTGVFHPKTWALRFVDDLGTYRHRMVVLSRNVTFDKSWDIAITLDEDPDSAFPPARDAGDFIASLPALAVRPLPAARLAAVADLAATMRRARLTPPKPFHSSQVWPLGGAAAKGSPYHDQPVRSLIVSPFLTGSTVRDIAGQASATLVSTQPALDALTEADLNAFDPIYVLSAALTVSQAATVDDPNGPLDPATATASTGLHAKIVIQDLPGQPRISRWIAGSVNATHNAHHANIEAAVVLEGPTSTCGVSAVLDSSDGDKDVTTLLDLLEPYARSGQQPTPEEEAASLLDQTLVDLAQHGADLTVTEASSEALYNLTAEFHGDWPDDVLLEARPIAIGYEGLTAPVDRSTKSVTWHDRTLAAITPYLLVTLTRGVTTISRVIVADLINAPEHRRERLLADMLRTAEDFLRYLLLLLGDGGADEDAWQQAVTRMLDTDTNTRTDGWDGGLPVLESLLRAASRDPGSLRHVKALVDDLRIAGVGATVIPDQFDNLWAALQTALPTKASR
jgi:hypothetical protein